MGKGDNLSAMSYRTLEVELENGRVRPRSAETLPARSLALLTLLDAPLPSVAVTCSDLADRWASLDRLPSDEAKSFADDLESSRPPLQLPKSAWE